MINIQLVRDVNKSYKVYKCIILGSLKNTNIVGLVTGSFDSGTTIQMSLLYIS